MAAALAVVGQRQAPHHPAPAGSNYEKWQGWPRTRVSLGGQGDDLDGVAELAKQVESLGCKDLVIDGTAANTSKTVANLVQFRKLALKKRFRPFGYPACLCHREDPMAQILKGFLHRQVCGHPRGGRLSQEEVLPLLTWRANLYSDPQKADSG